MFGFPNGTLEADQAANVPALGRNKSCVCHVCDILAHTHTHTQLLNSAFPGPNAYNMCVWIMYGYHISTAHNSDSKSTSTAPVILPPFQRICLFDHFFLPVSPSDSQSTRLSEYSPATNQNRSQQRLKKSRRKVMQTLFK